MNILCAICSARPQSYSNLKNIYKAIKIVRSKSSLDLAYIIYGPTPTPQNEAIFVLHGVLGSKRNWQPMCTKIAAHTNKPVIAVDARNHGDSPHSDDHSYFDLAADVSQLISKFSIKKSVIIGHSMGGRTGMVLALTEPSKVASLIVVDISPITTQAFLSIPKEAMDIMMSVDFNGLNSLNKAKKAVQNKMIQSKLFPNKEAIYLITTNLAKLLDDTVGWKCNVNALYKNINNIASFPNLDGKTYEGPTLFIGGKLSKFIPPEDITGIRKLFPNAHLQYIEDVWHNVHIEDPKAFFDTVVKFLDNSKNQERI